jgi:alpha-galactosidase
VRKRNPKITSHQETASKDNIKAGSPWQEIDWQASGSGAPVWTHWGAPSDVEIPLPEPGCALEVCPVVGMGWMQQPALEGHRPTPDGNIDWSPRWENSEIERQGHVTKITLTDKQAKLRWVQRWKLLADGRLWGVETELYNLGDTPYQLSWLASVTLPLPNRVNHVLTFGGRGSKEFSEHWNDLPDAAEFRRDNRRGRAQENFPGVMLGGKDLSESAGEGWAAHLGFSGNHSLIIEPLGDGRRQLQIGEHLESGEGVIPPGERYQAPTAYVAYSNEGLGGLSAAFHQCVRDDIIKWPDGMPTPRPVLLNTWEAMFFDQDEAHLKALAKTAAEMGIERFVLDDGWFHGRNDDTSSLGDWWPDEVKYPQGLGPFANYVTSLGMQFGLWVEPEMVNPDSVLYRKHPDWALQLPNRPQHLERHQLVLDLTRPEVCNYLLKKLDTLLATLPIRYLKWDMNRDLAPAASRGRAVGGAQSRAVYALMGRVRKAHPDVEIESCSSGGARADFGVLEHTHRIWVSDCNDPMERIGIQCGFLRFFPPEIMGAHVGASPVPSTQRTQRMSFRAAVALMGHFGVEQDISALDANQRNELAGWIALYKRLRGTIHSANIYQTEISDGVTAVLAWNADRKKGVLCVFRLTEGQQRFPNPVRLPWLRGVAKVNMISVPENDINAPEGWQDMAKGGRTVFGKLLAENGLPVPYMPAETAWVVELS